MIPRKVLLVMVALAAVILFSPLVYAVECPVPDTGQTKCYDGRGNEINPCPSPGQPFYGQDANYAPNNPHSYTDLGNGIVRDNVTGLEWQQVTAPGGYTWQEAIDYCEALTLGGHDDWRLPTIKELFTLVDSSIPYPGPTIDAAYFPDTVSSFYWSSTTAAFGPNSAWSIIFGDGSVDYDNKSYVDSVRAVRAGQCGSSGNFIDNGDGTVTDTGTGLMWQKDTVPRIYLWSQALFYCENLTLAGYTDWRLPNRNELQSIVDYTRVNPAINPVFNAVSSFYWSSTTEASRPDYAWFVDFYRGWVDVGFKSPGYYVRAVRAGQCRSLGDSDGDTVCDDTDNCPDNYNLFQFDCDSDGAGDICDPDTTDPDGDGVDAACDNCPDHYNASQEDADSDGVGDACDNCPATPNPNQLDSYPPGGNSCGDACECEGNFDNDNDQDSTDAASFKRYLGRSSMQNPCTNTDRCNGDFTCDSDVDSSDAALFKRNLGRSSMKNPCPICVTSPWCEY